MHTSGIVLPETIPETEWIGDRPVQKVSPTRKHSVLQRAFSGALNAWAKSGTRGQVGAESRFRASPPGEDRLPLVPDVAFMSYERLRSLSPKDHEVPPIAPEIVVEILRPDDRAKDVAEKRRVYFAWGVTLDSADPDTRTIEFYDIAGGDERVEASVESYCPASVPSLMLPAACDLRRNGDTGASTSEHQRPRASTSDSAEIRRLIGVAAMTMARRTTERIEPLGGRATLSAHISKTATSEELRIEV